MPSFPIERKSECIVIVRMKQADNKANVLSKSFIADFHATLDALEMNYSSDAVVLTGNGAFFSAGLDLKFIQACQKDAPKSTPQLVEYICQFDELCARLFHFPRPVAAAIEGHAIAGGTALIAACDFRISNGTGNFGMNEVRNGMSVPLNMLEIVRHAVPAQTSWNMFLTGKVFDAAEALKLGVIDEIAASDQLLERACAKVTYSKQSIKAYPSIKRMMQRPAAEIMAQNKSATRLMLERDYGMGKAKL